MNERQSIDVYGYSSNWLFGVLRQLVTLMTGGMLTMPVALRSGDWRGKVGDYVNASIGCMRRLISPQSIDCCSDLSDCQLRTC